MPAGNTLSLPSQAPPLAALQALRVTEVIMTAQLIAGLDRSSDQTPWSVESRIRGRRSTGPRSPGAKYYHTSPTTSIERPAVSDLLPVSRCHDAS